MAYHNYQKLIISHVLIRLLQPILALLEVYQDFHHGNVVHDLLEIGSVLLVLLEFYDSGETVSLVEVLLILRILYAFLR